MTCHITEDDKCQHGIPIESVDMHACPHDGFRCSPCGHPACHNVVARYKRDPFLGVKWFARCSLCGEKGALTDDKDEALAWEPTHHEAVSQR